MRFARNRLSKQPYHLTITNHLKKRKYLERNYTTPSKMKTKQINYLTMPPGNENVPCKTAITNLIPQIPTLISNSHHQIPTTKVNLKEIISTNITNLKIQETITAPASHQRRSEERRVGKECRSRWSPY